MGTEMTACTSKLNCMKGKLVRVGSKALFKVKQYSPEIMTVAGVAGLIYATYKFVEAKPKAEQILDQHAYKMEAIERVKVEHSDSYSESDERSDVVLSYAQTGKDFLFLYGPIVVLGVGSIAAIFGGQRILRKRNIAMAAAYKLVDAAFTEYRARVIEELGDDKDYHFRYGTEYQTITEKVVGEDGKTKKKRRKVQVISDTNEPSMYARVFKKHHYDESGGWIGSTQWSDGPEYNARTLYIKNSVVNDMLKAHGFLFLNDVYDELGFPKTQAGQMVGWVWNGDGDNYISFGKEVDALIDKTAGYEAYQDGHEFLLDFNVDGMIIDTAFK